MSDTDDVEEREPLVTLGRSARDECYHIVSRRHIPKSPEVLHRTLSVWEMALVGIGMTIGSGIFTILGAATHAAGPSVILSFFMVAKSTLAVGFCYAELSSRFPLSGSSYSFTYAVYGQLPAWLVGWNLILEYIIVTAVVARSWSYYMASFLGVLGLDYPERFLSIPVDALGIGLSNAAGGWQEEVIINLTAAMVILIVAFIVAFGARESMVTNTVLVTVKVAALLLCIAVGFTRISPSNYSPFFPKGASGLFQGSALAFFAYIGFEGIANLSEEAKEPVRDVPRAMLLSMSSCGVLYMLTAAVLVGMVPYYSVDINEPLAKLFQEAWLQGTVSISAVVGVLGSLLSGLLSSSRMIYALSRDRLLPPFLSWISPSGVPYMAVFAIALPGALLGTFFTVEFLARLTSVGICTSFVVVCSIVIVKRYQPSPPSSSPSFSALPISAPAALASSLSLEEPIVVAPVPDLASASRSVVAPHPQLVLTLLVAFEGFGIVMSVASYSAAIPSSVMYTFLGLMLAAALPFFFFHKPEQPSGLYLCPWVPLVPLFGMGATTHLIIGQGPTVFALYAAWAGLGLIVYGACGLRWHWRKTGGGEEEWEEVTGKQPAEDDY